MMKRIAALLLTLAVALCAALPVFAAGTIEVTEDVSVSDDYDWTRFKGQNVTLNVYNWGEYISNGSDDSVDVVAAFEKLTGIKVNYTTFDSNESLYAKLKQLDIKLYEAALDLGCDPRQAFFKVILPEISPAILSAFLICLTYSIDDFMISYFNCGTVETLPIAIYSMTRKKVSPEIYALSTIMFVVILSVILVSIAMESRSYRKDQKPLREEGAC